MVVLICRGASSGCFCDLQQHSRGTESMCPAKLNTFNSLVLYGTVLLTPAPYDGDEKPRFLTWTCSGNYKYLRKM